MLNTEGVNTCEEILNRDIICTKYTDFRIKTLDSR